MPWDAAGAVEDALHAARWTLRDAEVEPLLQRTLGDAVNAEGGAVHQHFLRHLETQERNLP